MTRKLLITTELGPGVGDTYCGKCSHLEHYVGAVFGRCRLFDAKVYGTGVARPRMHPRLPECIKAEELANESGGVP